MALDPSLPPLTWRKHTDETGPWAIEVFSGSFKVAEMTWAPDGEIQGVDVDVDYRRKGLATEMLRRARTLHPGVHHSTNLTDEGRAWSQKVASQTTGGLEVSLVPRGDFGGRNVVWEARVKDDQIVDPHGSLAGYLRYDSSGSRVRIKALEVNPGYQRQGVGRWLLMQLLGTYEREGIDPGEFTSAGADLWKEVTGEMVRPSTRMTHDNNRDWRYASRAKTAMADTLEDVIEVLERQIKNTEAAEVYTKTREHLLAGRIGKEFPNRLAAWGYLREIVPQTIPGFDPEWIEVMGAYATATAMVGWDPASKKAIFFLRDDAMNELVLLHEVAHLVLQYRGESDGHGPRFRAICTGLYSKHLGFSLFGRRAATKVASAPTGVEVMTGGDGDGTQYDAWVAYFDKATGAKIGYIDYSIYEGDISIKMVEIEPAFRRQGWATKLLQQIKSENPGAKVNPGYLTGDGGKWWPTVAGKNGPLPEGMKITDSYRRDPEGNPSEGLWWVVARIGEEFVGSLSVDITGEENVIDQVSVEEPYRRRGVATALLEYARRSYPSLIHSDVLTDDGRAWSQKAAGKNGPLPPITFRIREGRAGLSRGVYAQDPRGYEMGRLAWHEPGGEIIFVHVGEEWQRRGIATAMLAEARTLNPGVHHSTDLSPEGRQWSQKAAAQSR